MLVLLVITYILRYFSLFCLQVKHICLSENTSSSVSSCEYVSQGS